MAKPEGEGFEVTLRDGTRACLRPIRPDDKWRLQAGLQLLSPRSRLQRFHTPVNHFTDAQLRYLTDIDYRRHMAWIALNPDQPEEPGMGVGRYVCLSDAPHVAEAAITVVDRYQGIGLGSVLFVLTARSAIQQGVRTLRNFVLASNQAMLDIFEELGATRRYDGDGVYVVDMPLPEDPDDLPDTPAARMLRVVAGQAGPGPRPILSLPADRKET